MKKETKQEKQEETKKEKPNEYTLGRIKLVEWKNKDNKGNEYNSFQVRKFYKDENEEWKDTDNLGETDLRTLRDLLEQVIVEKFPVKFKEN